MSAQIVLENVGVELPNRVLFSNVNWTLYHGSRVALAGRNGSGKSTLMRIIAGQSEPSMGKCTTVGRRKLRVGYLDQSLLDSAVIQTKNLGDSKTTPIQYLTQKLEGEVPQDDWDTGVEEWKIRKTLMGLGYTDIMMDSPMSQLSGGWLLRLFISLTLLKEPEVLLLDEPTNHLDIMSIQWLEEFLEKEFKGSLILITHDVALQKRTTDSLAVLHGGNFIFRKHQNDYLTFIDSLQDEKEILRRTIIGIDKKMAENQEFINRYRAKARTATRAQSKMKANETLNAEKAELQDKLIRAEGFKFDLRFQFRMESLGSKFPLSAENVSFKYDKAGDPILKDIRFHVKRGQKIAIIGENGAGKTTLLNVLAERLTPTQGKIATGHEIRMGYFGQHQLDELALEHSVLDNLRMTAEGIGTEQLRGWLGAFGFHTNEDVLKLVKVLSGGERARLALLRILTTPINVCLLDEPTNHLDVETKELLKKAMLEFPGSVVFVSHDREFIEAIGERILHLTNDHKFTDHLGDLDSFFKKYPQFARHLNEQAATEKPKKTEQPVSTLSFEERKQVKNRIRSLSKKVVQWESSITDMGNQKTALETKLADPTYRSESSPEQQQAQAQQVRTWESEIHAKMLEWEKMSVELDSLVEKHPEFAPKD